MIVRFLRTGLVLIFAFATFNSFASESERFIQFVDESELPVNVLEALLKKRRFGDYRVVRVDTDALRQMLRDAYSSTSDTIKPSISLSLVDGTPIDVLLKNGGESNSGWQAGFASFLGSVAEDEYSTVQCLISPDGSADLVIRKAGNRYKLEKTEILPYHIYWSRELEFSKKID